MMPKKLKENIFFGTVFIVKKPPKEPCLDLSKFAFKKEGFFCMQKFFYEGVIQFAYFFVDLVDFMDNRLAEYEIEIIFRRILFLI